MRHRTVILRSLLLVAALLLAASATGDRLHAQPDSPRRERPQPAATPERLVQWCAALSFDQPRIRRQAFDLLRRVGVSAAPALVAALPSATPEGRQLLLLLLSRCPSPEALDAALAVLEDAEAQRATGEAAIRALARQDPSQLHARLVAVLSDATPLCRLAIYELLARLPPAVSLRVLLDSPPPPATPGESLDAIVAERIATMAAMLWQIAAYRSATVSGHTGQALQLLDRAPPALRPHATPVSAALTAVRGNAAALQGLDDRRHAMRLRAQDTLAAIGADHPVVLFAHLQAGDYRTRTLVLRLLRDSGHPLALLFTMRTVGDADVTVRDVALECLRQLGPVAPEQVLALAAWCDAAQRIHLRRLAAMFPETERLALLRSERERLAHLVVPHLYQRGLHDRVAARTWRAWVRVQGEWSRYDSLWRQWWAEHGAKLVSDQTLSLLDEYQALLDD